MKLKKTVHILSLIIAVLAVSLYTVKNEQTALTSAQMDKRPTVILDAGHGGFDGGAVAADGTIEKDINLKITLTLAGFLKQNGYNVILTRAADESTEDRDLSKISSRKRSDLKNRLNLMKKYPEAVFVSIHLNKFTTSAANGSQVFYSGNDERSKLLGDSIQRSIVKGIQPDNVRVNKKATSSTYLLYNAVVPAVLVECGFLSNSAELERLKNYDYQTKMAFCIYCGINDYFSK